MKVRTARVLYILPPQIEYPMGAKRSPAAEKAPAPQPADEGTIISGIMNQRLPGVCGGGRRTVVPWGTGMEILGK